jgi:hypothetical protein
MRKISWRRTSVAALGLCLALTGGLSGCGSCSKDKEPGGEAAGLPAKVTLLSAPLEGIQAPADVLAYGGTAPLNTLLGALSGLATTAGLPVPPLEAQFGLAIKAELNLKDEKVVDLKRSMRFAVLNPKLHAAEPVALLLGATSKDAFIAALPDDKKTGDEGNAYSYLRFPGSSQAIYVNFILDTVVVTRDKTIYPRYRDFLERLAMADIDRAAGVIIALRNLAAIYGTDLDAALAEVKKNARAAVSTIPGADRQAWMIDAFTDGVGRWTRELDDVRILLDTPADGLRAQVSFSPRANTELQKTFASLKGTSSGALLDRLPADAPFFLWMDVAPAKLQAISEKVAAMTVGAMLKADPAKKAEYDQAMVDALSVMSGEFALAAHAPLKGDGLSLSSIFGVTDSEKARKAQTKLSSVYLEPGAIEYYKKVGLEVDMKAAAYMVGDVPVGVFTTKIGDTNPQLAAMRDGLTELLTQHVAIGKDVGVLAIGTDARPTVEAMLGGSLKGGLRAAPGPARALKQAAPNPIAILYLSPIELARRVRLGGMNPVAPMLAGIESTTGIGLSLGTEAGALQMVIDLPVEQMQKIGQVVQKTKGTF